MKPREPKLIELPPTFRDPALLALAVKTKAGRRRCHQFVENAERVHAINARNQETCAEAIRLVRQALGEVKA